MLVWGLIASCWVGVLLLILHDTTKDDSSGSAIVAALRAVVLVVLKKLKSAFKGPKSTTITPAPAPQKTIGVERSVEKHASTIPASSSANPAQNGQTTTIEQQPVAAFHKKWWSKDRRASITSEELELTIADAIRKTAPGCDDFIGVIVDRKNPKLRLDPNWEIRGVKFGKADRKMVDEALATVVKRLQREYRLTDPQP